MAIEYEARTTIPTIAAHPCFRVHLVFPWWINNILTLRADPGGVILVGDLFDPSRNFFDLVIRQRNMPRHMRLDRLSMLQRRPHMDGTHIVVYFDESVVCIVQTHMHDEATLAVGMRSQHVVTRQGLRSLLQIKGRHPMLQKS